MDTNEVTKIKFIERLRQLKIALFTTNDIRKIFSLNNDNTVKQLLVRLRKANIVQRLVRDKYLFLLTTIPPHEFVIANFLVSPSYISLESALSFYRIIDQFPYRITSLTVLKSSERSVKNKKYVYSRIGNDKFKDFTKIDDFLIASKEKAIFDYIYFASKGLRSVNTLLDMKNYLKNKNINNYLLKNANTQLKKFINKYVRL